MTFINALEITSGLKDGLYVILDKKWKLYLFYYSNALHFGRGLRIGAIVKIHNAHPVMNKYGNAFMRYFNYF